MSAANSSDLIGKKFGLLTVIGHGHTEKRDVPKKRGEGTYKDTIHYVLCQCDCGEITEVLRSGLVTGAARYCGAKCNLRKVCREQDSSTVWREFGAGFGNGWYSKITAQGHTFILGRYDTRARAIKRYCEADAKLALGPMVFAKWFDESLGNRYKKIIQKEESHEGRQEAGTEGLNE